MHTHTHTTHTHTRHTHTHTTHTHTHQYRLSFAAEEEGRYETDDLWNTHTLPHTHTRTLYTTPSSSPHTLPHKHIHTHTRTNTHTHTYTHTHNLDTLNAFLSGGRGREIACMQQKREQYFFCAKIKYKCNFYSRTVSTTTPAVQNGISFSLIRFAVSF